MTEQHACNARHPLQHEITNTVISVSSALWCIVYPGCVLFLVFSGYFTWSVNSLLHIVGSQGLSDGLAINSRCIQIGDE